MRSIFFASAISFIWSSAAFGGDNQKIDIPEPPPAVRKLKAESLEDLREISKQTKLVVDKVAPTVVGIFNAGSAGSGVIVSKDGIVLTAGHVSGEPGKMMDVVLTDGRRLKAKSLGRNTPIDSGMIKITTDGEYPFAKLAKQSDMKEGDWVIALGHPGGFKEGRSPVVRVGKLSSIISDRDGSITALRTDCTLVGGDSGGPLFDMQGRVIGIHSRINQEITTNIHVPIGTYRETWARLLKGADIGQVWFGVSQADDSSDCKLGRITEKSPAEKAGLKEGDVILKFDNQLVSTYKEMRNILNEKDAGDEVEVEIRRGDKTMTLKVTLAKKTDKERR